MFWNLATFQLTQNVLADFRLAWERDLGNTYSVYGSTNLLQGVTNVLQTGIDATPGNNSFRDATATNTGVYFYRVKRK